jgi:hypothetical protein
MYTLQQMADTAYQELQEALQAIQAAAKSFQEEAETSIPIIRSHLQKIKSKALAESLEKEEEIYLFKHIKPKFYSLLIYYYKALQIELGKPAAGYKALLRYMKAHQSKLVYFFKKYRFFHLYCRSHSTSLDDQFFVRGKLDLLPGIAMYGIDTDPSFTTGYDFLLAKMKANELIQRYLDNEMARYNKPQLSLDENVKKVTWTGSKAALIELLYALQSTGVLNNGTVALNDIAQFIETVFGIKLGNYYRVFQEIRIRKKSRTQFLDEMKERLIQKMDYADENPHIS